MAASEEPLLEDHMRVAAAAVPGSGLRSNSASGASKAADPARRFEEELHRRAASFAGDRELLELSRQWLEVSMRRHYTYNFHWLGRPIIQYPQDIVAIQELVWQVRPDLIIETGIAHGGSLILSASMLALLDISDAIGAGTTMDPRTSGRRVLGVDIDIRAHNRSAIEAHPMSSRVEMIQGASTDPDVVAQVRDVAARYQRVLVCLDSMHTHEHVLAELAAYAPLTSVGSYCVVFDTFVEDVPAEVFPGRPWSPGNSPKTAAREYLKTHPEFAADREIQHRLLITSAPEGFLKRIA